jgi:hypothetical protein
MRHVHERGKAELKERARKGRVTRICHSRFAAKGKRGLYLSGLAVPKRGLYSTCLSVRAEPCIGALALVLLCKAAAYSAYKGRVAVFHFLLVFQAVLHGLTAHSQSRTLRCTE